MKSPENGVSGDSVPGGSGGNSVLVGVKLDTQSRELLTWALVKVAQPGDLVVALHILGKDEIMDQNGTFLLVEAFEAALAVYDGFCNLKQVDLKLKICRGDSARKTLVREARNYSASAIVVGTSGNSHKIRSSTSVAKYCARKLPKDCWIFAVENGKVFYRREGSPATIRDSPGIKDHHKYGVFEAIKRSLSPKILSDDNNANVVTKKNDDLGFSQNYEQGSQNEGFDGRNSNAKRKCSICAPSFALLDLSRKKSAEEPSGDGKKEGSLPIFPVQPVVVASSEISSLMLELPELGSQQPLFQQNDKADKQDSCGSLAKKISGVRQRIKSHKRCLSLPIAFDHKQSTFDESCYLNEESGTIIEVGDEGLADPPSPDQCLKRLCRELRCLLLKYSSSCKLFNYEELVSATSNFPAGNLIGKGGSSQVYRGSLPDGKKVAVKILKPSEDVLNEFIWEIEILTALNHQNIVSFLGFCFEDSNLLLVYDFLSGGNLEENLHGNKRALAKLGWNERHKIAIGVAKALDYLHCGTARSVIHGDVKSSNILLSDNLEPQLSDFGLARWASASLSYITATDVAGTFGYLAPEYLMCGEVNVKIDVYAFGVVLLELLSGRKPISNGHESLVMWAEPILNGGNADQLLDASLRDNYDQDQMKRMVLAATLCIRHAPPARPQMSTVLKILQGDGDAIMCAKQHVEAVEEADVVEWGSRSNLRSLLDLALLDTEDDSVSPSSN